MVVFFADTGIKQHLSWAPCKAPALTNRLYRGYNKGTDLSSVT